VVMVRAGFFGISCLLATSACAGGAGTPGGSQDKPAPSLPADKPLRELSRVEAQALCEWESALLARGNCMQNAILSGGFQAQISADPATVANARGICGTELELCTAPDAMATGILDCTKQIQTGFLKCALRVSDAESCDRDLARDYAMQPECGALTEESFRQVLYRTDPVSCQHPECRN
jgi:hypothetical protein